LLHAIKPFRRALDIDIARVSIGAAHALVGGAPIDYKIASDPSAWPEHFDFAFSYEVVYLLPDIAVRVAGMHAALRRGGSIMW